MTCRLITYLFFSNIAVPYLSCYIFFVTWGYCLKDKRLDLKIESLFVSPKGAGLASLLGLMFTLLGTLPLSVFGAVIIKKISGKRNKSASVFLGAAAGSLLGYQIQRSHFKSLFPMELGVLGGLAGMLVSLIGVMLLRGEREKE